MFATEINQSLGERVHLSQRCSDGGKVNELSLSFKVANLSSEIIFVGTILVSDFGLKLIFYVKTVKYYDVSFPSNYFVGV